MKRNFILGFLCSLFSVLHTHAAQFSVTNINDSGAGSFRQAVIDANATIALDTIVFNIPGSGPHEIQLLTTLTTINRPVYIDGSTQLGYVANTTTFPSPMNGTVAISINLSTIAAGSRGMTVSGTSNVTWRAINFFGNTSSQTSLSITNSTNVRVYGCYIGCLADGLTSFVGQQAGGITISGTSSDIFIGSASPADRNIFGAHTSNLTGSDKSIFVNSATVSNIFIRGNYVGIAKDGVTMFSPSENNIIVQNSASPSIWVGGETMAEGNVSVGATGVGIWLTNTTDTVFVQNNIVGTDYLGTSAKPNNTGIRLAGATRAKVVNNLSSGNSTNGIDIRDGATGNVVLRNKCGVDISGIVALPNTLDGIQCNNIGGGTNLIGNGTLLGANLCSGNLRYGINIVRPSGDIINRNFIGVNPSGTTIPNGSDGIFANQVDNISILNNVISANTGRGLAIVTATNPVIKGNTIGLLPDNVTSAANGSDGIFLGAGVVGATIGSTTSGEGNLIAYNGGHGINVSSGGVSTSNRIEANQIYRNTLDGIAIIGSTENTITQNVIYENGGLGIDLSNDGVTLNDAGDVDTSVPNHHLNFPVINYVSISSLIMNFDLDVPAGDYRVEVFGVPSGQGDPSHHGEGNTYLGAFSINHTGSGVENFNYTLPGVFPISAGDSIAMTVTQCLDGTCTSFGSTSEFSELKTAVPLPISLLSFDAKYSQDRVNITWATLSEQNSSMFEVLHSANNQDWTVIDRQQAAGNSNSLRSYSTYHFTPNKGLNYYQLKSTDLDGSYTLSRVVELIFDKSPVLSLVYPNPTQGSLYVTSNLPNISNVYVYNSIGQLVFTQSLEALEQNKEIKTSDWEPGIYTVQLQNNRNIISTHKVCIIK